jgi:hypothetical protein
MIALNQRMSVSDPIEHDLLRTDVRAGPLPFTWQ